MMLWCNFFVTNNHVHVDFNVKLFFINMTSNKFANKDIEKYELNIQIMLSFCQNHKYYFDD